ncbi:unnamed protein product [Withania somnifera]
MDNEYFSSGGIQPPLHFQPKIQSPQEPNIDYFMNTHWENNSTDDQYTHFDSALSSIVSSVNSKDSSSLCELIGKLGSICSSPQPIPFTNSSSSNMSSCNFTSVTCYTTPLNSPPKLHFPIMNQMGIENSNLMNGGAPFSAPSVAKFSCFGSRSFNDRTSQVGLNNGGSRYGSDPSGTVRGNLTRISSSPSLGKSLGPNVNSNEECSVSEQVPSGEMGSKTRNALNSRKRKAVSRMKTKNSVPIGDETEDGIGRKRSKSIQDNGNYNGTIKMEGEKGSEDDDGAEKEAKEKKNIIEPPKDYIHVRARRGQATDSHSLAERVRREKISQRMKLLQDLVPGCNKVTGKALMLDEIINYVQSLQRQVEFLSMKLASVNPRMDFHIDYLLHKDISQPNGSLHQNVFPLDEYSENLTQLPTICEDDLQSIVQMGFNQNLILQSQTFPVPNSESQMKVEM